MNKLILAGVFLALLCGKSFAGWADGIKFVDIVNTTTAYKFAHNTYIFETTIKGHDYIIKDGIIHSESCPCKIKLEVLDNGNIERARKNGN